MNIDLSQFKAVDATIQSMSLTDAHGVETPLTLHYENGQFTAQTRVIPQQPGATDPTPVPLDAEDRKTLLRQLQTELEHPPEGVDVEALRCFVHLLGRPVHVEPSTLFDHASIVSIDRFDTNGMLVAHFRLNESFEAMVVDFGDILLAQHPIGWHSIPQVMSRPDLASLARFIIRAAPADPLFKQLLADVQAHL